MSSTGVIIRTIKYLKPKQVFYRLLYYKRKVKLKRLSKKAITGVSKGNRFTGYQFGFITRPHSFTPEHHFSFLNLSKNFEGVIDWDFDEYGKLWTYTLNYFDFLLQPGFSKEEGLQLMHQYLDSFPCSKTGFESYPLSLRLMNWVKFCLQHKVDDLRINSSIAGQTNFLSKNLEYHLLANHLLENAFALCFGALYSGNMRLFDRGIRILLSELHEQILPDGGHYERSAMYHQLLLGRLIEFLHFSENVIKGNNYIYQLSFLRETASRMLGWNANISFFGKNMPRFNDVADNIAPTVEQLLAYAETCKIEPSSLSLNESGFRKLCDKNFELLIDVGTISPSYQPGHAHAGTLSFELYARGKPIIVNTGTSTYEAGERRHYERSTQAHNTVSVQSHNSSEVWASHRVGRRANATLTKDQSDCIEACHDGYRKYGVLHKRRIEKQKSELIITDEICATNKKHSFAQAHLHFYPDTDLIISKNTLLLDGFIHIGFEGLSKLQLLDYYYAPEFNMLRPAKKCVVVFEKTLKTSIRVLSPKN